MSASSSSSRGQLPKVYLRLDPLIDSHPDWPAMVLLMLWANRQPQRGYFKSEELPRKLLGRKRFEACLERGDLKRKRGGMLHLDGWEEWQEGDLTVGERVRRLRDRRASRKPAVTQPFQDRNTAPKALGVRRQASGAESNNNPPAGAGGAAGNNGGEPAAAPPAGGGWVPHDHGNPEQVRLVARCEELAAALASEEEPPREATDADRLEVLRAVTSTPKGKSIRALRGAPHGWVEESLRAAEVFARDHDLPADEPGEES